jgi:hypothetical protein
MRRTCNNNGRARCHSGQCKPARSQNGPNLNDHDELSSIEDEAGPSASIISYFTEHAHSTACSVLVLRTIVGLFLLTATSREKKGDRTCGSRWYLEQLQDAARSPHFKHFLRHTIRDPITSAPGNVAEATRSSGRWELIVDPAAGSPASQ